MLAEEQVQAASKETVLAAMGTAVSAFREKLGESLASIQRYDAKIEEATTRSLEALKAYSQGLRTRRTTGDFDSVPFFRRAIDLDPEFALAYARLGTVYANLGQARRVAQDDDARLRAARQGQRGRAALHRRALLHDRAAGRAEGARYLQGVARDLSERLHRAHQLGAAAQAAGRSRRGDSQARARDAGGARSAARLDQPRPDLLRGRAVRRRPPRHGERDQAAGLDQCARRPLSGRDADRRHARSPSSRSRRCAAAATKST